MPAETAEEPCVVVQEEEGGRVAHVRLFAPPENALDLRLLDSFQRAVEALASWPSLVCVVLEGTGRDFSTGFAPAHLRPPYAELLLSTFHATARALASLDAILVAQVKGRCFGASAALTLLCHAVFSDATARFSFPEVGRGQLSPLASLLLPGRIGELRATPWLLSGRVIEPDEALAAGFLTATASGWDSVVTLTDRFLDQMVLLHSKPAISAQVRALRLPLQARLNDDLAALEQLALGRLTSG